MTAKHVVPSVRPRPTARPTVRPTARRRVDDEYRLTPKTVYRLTGGLAAFGVLWMIVAAFSYGKPTATLTGRVTHRGKPVIWGSVIVYGPDGRATAGLIQPDGTYSVEDVPPVGVTMAVVSIDPAVQHPKTQIKMLRDRVSMRKWEPPPVDRKQWFPLPQKYEDPQSSGLAVLLTKGANQHDIELP